MGKKILWIVLLVAILVAMIVGLGSAKKTENKVASTTTNTTFGKNTNTLEIANTTKTESSSQSGIDINVSENALANLISNSVANNTASTANTTESNTTVVTTNEKTSNSSGYQKTTLKDGVLYSKGGKEYKADIVIDEKFYDTTINDIWLNPDSYKNKNIEIEGMFLSNAPYTFVGRYSTSNICPNCPPGYSYFEFLLDGEIDKKLADEKDWIKVIGTLAVGNDETSNYQNYYYLDVLSLEIMNKKGNDTVSN